MQQVALITGSAGMIGGALIRRAIYEQQPYKFVSIDRISSGSALNGIYINKDHQFYIGDITDAHLTNIIFEKERPNIVIHAAAEYTNDNERMIRSNTLGTQILLDCCHKWGVSKIVYLSSDNVYGELASEDDARFIETSYLKPNGTYAASKAAGELLVQASGMNYNILRLSNTYGPRQNIHRLIPKAIKAILNNEKIQLFAQGGQLRDWMHIYDACAAILTILRKDTSNEIYNLSSNQELSSLDIIQKVCNIMEKGHDLITFADDATKRDFRRSTNNEKLKQLGWAPQFKITDGLKETSEWYAKNKWFIQQQ